MLKIYTKTGDKGKTSLFSGKRVSKASLRVEAYGEVDELNSIIGILIVQNSKFKIPHFAKASRGRQNYSLKLKVELLKIQNDLLEIGSLLANPVSKRSHLLKGATLTQKVKELERLIDDLSKELPELKNFILPGGGEAGSILHFARAVCRRAERKIVALSEKEDIGNQALVYLNRLSDLLFIMARYINFKENKREKIWNKK